jgi:hypothetical protein
MSPFFRKIPAQMLPRLGLAWDLLEPRVKLLVEVR